MTRLDWKLTEILTEELLKVLEINEADLNKEQSNFITREVDEIVHEALDDLTLISQSEEFKRDLESFNED